jgi:KilA-N domain
MKIPGEDFLKSDRILFYFYIVPAFPPFSATCTCIIVVDRYLLSIEAISRKIFKYDFMPNTKQIIEVKATPITIIQINQTDYISLTNIARHKNPAEPKDIIKNWMRPKTTIEFLGL